MNGCIFLKCQLSNDTGTNVGLTNWNGLDFGKGKWVHEKERDGRDKHLLMKVHKTFERNTSKVHTLDDGNVMSAFVGLNEKNNKPPPPAEPPPSYIVDISASTLTHLNRETYMSIALLLLYVHVDGVFEFFYVWY
jgi:hypothetical protein